jgi:AraC-like DNA-binding protein
MNKKKTLNLPNQNSLSQSLIFLESIKLKWVSSANWECDRDWQLPPRQLNDVFIFLPLEGQMQGNTEEESFFLKPGCLWWVDENTTHWARFHGRGELLKVLAFHFHLEHRHGDRFRISPSSGSFQLSEEWVHRLSRLVYFEQQGMGHQDSFFSHEMFALFLELHDSETLNFLSPPEIDSRLRELLKWLEEQRAWIPSVLDCSQQVGLSTVHLRSLFKQHLGKKPHDYILRQRLGWAREALLTKTDSIAKVGREHGFASPQQFHRAFKKIYGLTPAQLRQTDESLI